MLALAVGCAPPVKTEASQEKKPPLFPNVGTRSTPVTVDVPHAQRYFDQGLALSYGFNHGEAERSFEYAATIDPSCAMCYWGAALVLGPNINAPMDDASVPHAWESIQVAQKLRPYVTERERDYINALSVRYAAHPVKDRKPLDVAYAQAMQKLALRYPDDLDAQTLYVEALMDLHPWDYWSPDGKTARPWTPEILARLDAVLARDPKHLGANHLYIHAVEASADPARGLAAADRLGTLAPAAGHLTHMPAHIYMRVGRYHDASIANQRAAAADSKYLAQCHAAGLYPATYGNHNHHFLWASAAMEGRSAVSIDAANHLAQHVDEKMMREKGLGTLQHYWITPLYAEVRMGKWEEILAAKEPADDLPYPRGVWHYARGTALAATGKTKAARSELESLQKIAADPALASLTIWDINKSSDLLAVAVEVLSGKVAASERDWPNAESHLRRAVALESKLHYDEPPPWHYPVRHSLGAVLLAAGNDPAAETVFREDLVINPENGWALLGLTESLRRQGKMADAAATQARFNQAWQYADFRPTSPDLGIPVTAAAAPVAAEPAATEPGGVAPAPAETAPPAAEPAGDGAAGTGEPATSP